MSRTNVPSQIALSDAAILRGQLKHSWLENEVLNISIETVISLWRRGGSNLGVRYAARTRDLQHLTDSLAESFSPARLVDTLEPFSGLSAEDKSAVKAAVHAAYLESSDILALQAPLKVAAAGMEAVLQELSRAWLLLQPGGECAVRAAWEGVCDKAGALIVELERLPKGLELP